MIPIILFVRTSTGTVYTLIIAMPFPPAIGWTISRSGLNFTVRRLVWNANTSHLEVWLDFPATEPTIEQLIQAGWHEYDYIPY